VRDLIGKTAIVTGAASGIGLGIARAFAMEGANLVLADIRPEPLASARMEVVRLGVEAIAIPTDVSVLSEVEALGRAAEATFGKVHIAVNNAGIAFHGTPLTQVGMRDWEWVVGVNIYGVIHGIRTFVPLMQRHGEGGHIVNTASTAGFRVTPGLQHGAYAMTKHAVIALSEALRHELENTDIGVSALCPGAVNTKLDASSAYRPDRLGGAYERPEHGFMREFMEQGLSPDWVGQRLLQGIKAREFLIFTSSAPRQWIAGRHQIVSDAFDRIEALENPPRPT